MPNLFRHPIIKVATVLKRFVLTITLQVGTETSSAWQ